MESRGLQAEREVGAGGSREGVQSDAGTVGTLVRGELIIGIMVGGGTVCHIRNDRNCGRLADLGWVAGVLDCGAVVNEGVPPEMAAGVRTRNGVASPLEDFVGDGAAELVWGDASQVVSERIGWARGAEWLERERRRKCRRGMPKPRGVMLAVVSCCRNCSRASEGRWAGVRNCARRTCWWNSRAGRVSSEENLGL